jgi:hypothetical protein
MTAVLNFNRANLSLEPINELINKLIEQAEPPSENFRRYLGASSIGAECLRKVQYDWMCDPVFPARIKDIFARGHFFEEVTRKHLIAAGFKFAPKERLKFEAAGGLFRGHADGIIVAGPELPDLRYPCLWESKCLKAKGWREIERDGLKNHPQYKGQVALYMAYLNVADHPALFTAVNADTAERVHLTIPFDAQLAQAMSDRAVEIIRATRAGELLPRGYDDSADWHCKCCSHKARCWEQQS